MCMRQHVYSEYPKKKSTATSIDTQQGATLLNNVHSYTCTFNLYLFLISVSVTATTTTSDVVHETKS